MRHFLIDTDTASDDAVAIIMALKCKDVKVEAIVVEKPGLDVAFGAIGIGEITSIPTAPAIAHAYARYDGKFRTSLPLEDTPYSKKK